MAREPEPPCVAHLLEGFLHAFGCRLVNADEIESTIRAIAQARGEIWPWVEKWVAEEGPRWVNDLSTIVFEVPLANLEGRNALHFTQQIWMLHPSLFEYQTWNDRGYVRIFWDRDSGAAPCIGEADEPERDCPMLAQPQYVAWSLRKRQEGAPGALMDSLDQLTILVRPREAAALTEDDFERWLEEARRQTR